MNMTAAKETGIDATQLARRFGLKYRAARSWLKTLPHYCIGRQRFTTEAWIAEWMAANVKCPAPKNFDPLDQAVIERAAQVVGELVRQGRVIVTADSLKAELQPRAA